MCLSFNAEFAEFQDKFKKLTDEEVKLKYDWLVWAGWEKHIEKKDILMNIGKRHIVYTKMEQIRDHVRATMWVAHALKSVVPTDMSDPEFEALCDRHRSGK